MVTLKTLIINVPASLRDALDQISGKFASIRHIVAFRPGALTSTNRFGQNRHTRPGATAGWY
ncbi:hypothetical protein [Novosphingobium sp. AAP83]|uniref:hypothetical protein n=1 Tax=Novosphingobium sp. AAP83 TaxID=1523425 RepID=UPI000B0B4687|nr:hypothetical protein [Novosphingobium sp. AAP83]